MTEYAGAGDQRRSMELLWGRFEPPARGPRRDLSVAAITEAAVAVADAEGLAAVSMRRVAKELGRGPMTLYTYVPSKSELVDLMLEHALGELAATGHVDGGWRARAEAWARLGWTYYLTHPWVLQISGARPLLSPNELRVFEASMAVFDGTSLTPTERMRYAGAVGAYVRGAAKAVADTRTAAQVTGISEEDWWTSRSAHMEEFSADLDWAGEMPNIAALDDDRVFEQPERAEGDQAGYLEWEETDTFEHGLQLMLDGIESRITTQRKASRGSR